MEILKYINYFFLGKGLKKEITVEINQDLKQSPTDNEMEMIKNLNELLKDVNISNDLNILIMIVDKFRENKEKLLLEISNFNLMQQSPSPLSYDYFESIIKSVNSSFNFILNNGIEKVQVFLNVINFNNYVVESFFFFSIIIIFLLSLIKSSSNTLLMRKNSGYLGILLLIFIEILFLNMILTSPNFESSFFYNIVSNEFILFIKQIIILITLFILILNISIEFEISPFLFKQYLNKNNEKKELNKINSYEFVLLLLLSTWAILFLIESTDLLAIYLLIELQSFCYYILTATKSNSNFSTEAGLKYFILGSLSSGILLFGISLIYGLTGLTNLNELKLLLFSSSSAFFDKEIEFQNYVNNNLAIILALILIMVSILFKFGLVPFHNYIPDVYSGAPTIVTTLFLVIQKLVILLVYLNLYNNVFINFYNEINYLIMFSIITSIIIGSAGALAQIKVKRLIAYSAIVNGGFLFIGVSTGSNDGIAATFLFLFIYIILILTLFFMYNGIRYFHNNIKFNSLKDFILLKKSNIILAICFTLVLFSIAGIPPLAGFYGKLFLFIAAIKENAYVLAIIAILFTVVTSYYYLRLIKIMFFEKVLEFVLLKPILRVNSYVISMFTLLNLIFFYHLN